jgi:hypothetical protein
MQTINNLIALNKKPRRGEVNYLVLIYIVLTMVNFIV